MISAVLEKDAKEIADIVFENSMKILGPRNEVMEMKKEKKSEEKIE